jgi:excisionase family DNA binding protein
MCHARQQYETRKGEGMSDDKLLNTEEIAEYLRISTVFARRLLRQGKLKGKKVGKEWRVKKSDLQEYLNQDETQQR